VVLADRAAEKALEESVGGEYVTLRVYVFLLKAGDASLRDVYRGCGLSSPSLALHHLKKLEGLSLLRRDENGVYHVIVKRFGVLRFFHKVGSWLLPRSFFYMMLYASIAVASVFYLPSGIWEAAVIMSAVGFTISLIDTVLFLRLIS
jgi:hypothetical protein